MFHNFFRTFSLLFFCMMGSANGTELVIEFCGFEPRH